MVHELASQEAERVKRNRSAGATALGKARAEFTRAGIDFLDTPAVRDVRALALESRQTIAGELQAEIMYQFVLNNDDVSLEFDAVVHLAEYVQPTELTKYPA